LSEPDYVAENRALWTQSNAEYTDESARRSWSRDEITFSGSSATDRAIHWQIEVEEGRLVA